MEAEEGFASNFRTPHPMEMADTTAEKLPGDRNVRLSPGGSTLQHCFGAMLEPTVNSLYF